MFDPDVPALRPDGTLKDASEIEWICSPSAEKRTLPPESVAGDTSGSDGNEPVNPAPPKRLKGKEPAQRVGGKRIARPSNKVSASKEQCLSPKTIFFFSRFEGIFSVLIYLQ